MSKSSNLYQVESIIDHRVESGKDYFKVHWLGYSSKDDTWEPVENLTNCQDLVEAFMDKAAEERRRSLRSRDSSSQRTPLFSSDEEDIVSTGPRKTKRVKKTSPSKKTAQGSVTPTKKTTRASVTPTKKATLEDSSRKYNLRTRTAEYSSEDESVLDSSRNAKTTRMTLTESKFKKQLDDIKKGKYSASPHKTSTPQKSSPKPVKKPSPPPSKVQATKKLLFDSSTNGPRQRVSNRPPTRQSQRLLEKSMVAEAPPSIAEDISVVAQADDDDDLDYPPPVQKIVDEQVIPEPEKMEEERCFPVTWMEFALAAFVTGVAAVGYICYTTDYCGYC